MNKEAAVQYKEGISVIIPVYNAEKTIAACVNSVCAQDTALPIEILLVDDGSTDDSKNVCDTLAKENGTPSREIFVYTMENGGVSRARNKGLKHATRSYLAFVDADDTVRPDFFSGLLQTLSDTGACMVCANDRLPKGRRISGFAFVRQGILQADTHVWGKLFSHAWIAERGIRFPEDLTIGEDMLFLLSAALCMGDEKAIVCGREGGYRYTENPEGAMLKTYDASFNDQITCWQRAGKNMLAEKEHLGKAAFARLYAIRIISALLVAGKIAQSEKGSRKSAGAKGAVLRCKAEIARCLKHRGVFFLLPAGYKIKTVFFCLSENAYLSCYHLMKRIQKRSGA